MLEVLFAPWSALLRVQDPSVWSQSSVSTAGLKRTSWKILKHDSNIEMLKSLSLDTWFKCPLKRFFFFKWQPVLTPSSSEIDVLPPHPETIVIPWRQAKDAHGGGESRKAVCVGFVGLKKIIKCREGWMDGHHTGLSSRRAAFASSLKRSAHFLNLSTLFFSLNMSTIYLYCF